MNPNDENCKSSVITPIAIGASVASIMAIGTGLYFYISYNPDGGTTAPPNKCTLIDHGQYLSGCNFTSLCRESTNVSEKTIACRLNYRGLQHPIVKMANITWEAFVDGGVTSIVSIYTNGMCFSGSKPVQNESCAVKNCVDSVNGSLCMPANSNVIELSMADCVSTTGVRPMVKANLTVWMYPNNEPLGSSDNGIVALGMTPHSVTLNSNAIDALCWW